MAPKVKVAEFIASSARYAKKAAAAADKNADKKLSKTEAKALPKDLRDDYARMAKKKPNVTVASFARDQAAYVAVAAKKADKNKDGIISGPEAKGALPADLRDNYANYLDSLSTTGGPTG